MVDAVKYFTSVAFLFLLFHLNRMCVPHFIFCSWFMIFSLILWVGRDGVPWFYSCQWAYFARPGW